MDRRWVVYTTDSGYAIIIGVFGDLRAGLQRIMDGVIEDAYIDDYAYLDWLRRNRFDRSQHPIKEFADSVRTELEREFDTYLRKELEYPGSDGGFRHLGVKWLITSVPYRG